MTVDLDGRVYGTNFALARNLIQNPPYPTSNANFMSAAKRGKNLKFLPLFACMGTEGLEPPLLRTGT
jgi:hypothetical protein